MHFFLVRNRLFLEFVSSWLYLKVVLSKYVNQTHQRQIKHLLTILCCIRCCIRCLVVLDVITVFICLEKCYHVHHWIMNLFNPFKMVLLKNCILFCFCDMYLSLTEYRMYMFSISFKNCNPSVVGGIMILSYIELIYVICKTYFWWYSPRVFFIKLMSK